LQKWEITVDSILQLNIPNHIRFGGDRN